MSFDCTTKLIGLFSSFYFYLFAGTCFASSRRFLTDFLQEFPTPGTGPYFDTTIPSNITGLVGKNVHLVCKVSATFRYFIWFSMEICCRSKVFIKLTSNNLEISFHSDYGGQSKSQGKHSISRSRSMKRK